jgi:hypothetical protein
VFDVLTYLSIISFVTSEKYTDHLNPVNYQQQIFLVIILLVHYPMRVAILAYHVITPSDNEASIKGNLVYRKWSIRHIKKYQSSISRTFNCNVVYLSTLRAPNISFIQQWPLHWLYVQMYDCKVSCRQNGAQTLGSRIFFIFFRFYQ